MNVCHLFSPVYLWIFKITSFLNMHFFANYKDNNACGWNLKIKEYRIKSNLSLFVLPQPLPLFPNDFLKESAVDSLFFLLRILVQESPGNIYQEHCPQMVFVYICEVVTFPLELNMRLSKHEVGSQNSEQTRGSRVGPLSVSHNFYGSVNLCLTALAWPS